MNVNIEELEESLEKYISLKDFKKAIEICSQLLELNTNSLRYLKKIIFILLKLKNYHQALAFCDKLIEKSVTAVGYYNKALVYNLMKDENNAINSINLCVEKDVRYIDIMKDDPAFQNLAWVFNPSQIFKVTEEISLRLICSRTVLYICDEIFSICIGVVYNIKIDEVGEVVDEEQIILEQNLAPEEEFWVHCSNLQAWVENNYDHHLLLGNTSFHILKHMISKGVSKLTPFFVDSIINGLKEYKDSRGEKFIFLALEEDLLSFVSSTDLFYGLLDPVEARAMDELHSFLRKEYTITISLHDAYRYGYTSKGKLHFCAFNGHITELEFEVSDYNLSLFLEKISSFKRLESLYIRESFAGLSDLNDLELKKNLKERFNFDFGLSGFNDFTQFNVSYHPNTNNNDGEEEFVKFYEERDISLEKVLVYKDRVFDYIRSFPPEIGARFEDIENKFKISKDLIIDTLYYLMKKQMIFPLDVNVYTPDF